MNDQPSMEPAEDKSGASRREALAAVGRFAAYSSPAVVALLTSTRAAHASCVNPGGGRPNQNSANCR